MNKCKWLILLALFSNAYASTPAVTTSEVNGIAYLTSKSGNHTARIGLNTAWGGSIVEVSLDGINYVNEHDTGRNVQISFYDGNQPYTNFNCSPCIGTWGWNPVLGGDKYNHGSPVTSVQLNGTSLSITSTPLEWNPDDKGGGANVPIVSDITVQQIVTLVPNEPLAFKIHTIVTHMGSDLHYTNNQEFPAVYVGSQYNKITYYGGTNPWTNAPITSKNLSLNATTTYYSEKWSSYTNNSNLGLTVYVPSQYPIFTAAQIPGSGGSGPFGDNSNYSRQIAPMTISPYFTFSSDFYLIPGSISSARSSIYSIEKTLLNSDIAFPLANVESPSPNSILNGIVYISGWAFDNVAVSAIQIFVDGILYSTTTPTTQRPDVASAYPNLAPLYSGWAMPFNTSSYSNGTHFILVKIIDTSSNITIYPIIKVLISN
jgi:hypothetical protein